MTHPQEQPEPFTGFIAATMLRRKFLSAASWKTSACRYYGSGYISMFRHTEMLGAFCPAAYFWLRHI